MVSSSHVGKIGNLRPHTSTKAWKTGRTVSGVRILILMSRSSDCFLQHFSQNSFKLGKKCCTTWDHAGRCSFKSPCYWNLFYTVVTIFIQVYYLWPQIFTTILGSLKLGQQGLNMRQKKVLGNGKLYSVHQKISTLRIKKSHLSIKLQRQATCYIWQKHVSE